MLAAYQRFALKEPNQKARPKSALPQFCCFQKAIAFHLGNRVVREVLLVQSRAGLEQPQYRLAVGFYYVTGSLRSGLFLLSYFFFIAAAMTSSTLSRFITSRYLFEILAKISLALVSCQSASLILHSTILNLTNSGIASLQLFSFARLLLSSCSASKTSLGQRGLLKDCILI